MRKSVVEKLIKEAESKGKAETKDFYIYYDKKWNSYSLHRKKGYCSNFGKNKEFLVEYIVNNYKTYYLKYHSQMTDTNIYFVSDEKEKLKKYEFLFNLLLDGNYQEDFETILDLLKEKKIDIYNSEYNNFNEEDFDIMLNYYSFRF